MQYVLFEIGILKELTRISLTSEKTNERNAAANLRRNMDSFEFVVFIVLWERILRAFDSSSRKLQSAGYAFKVNVFYYRTIDVALHELNTRFEGNQSVVKLISFLYPRRLGTSSYEDIKTSTANSINF